MTEQFLTIILIAVVLGMDAFSLSLAMGLKGVSRQYENRFALSVGIFHVFMPLIGLYLGYAVGQVLGHWAGILGAAVLAYIGITFVLEGYKAIKCNSQPISGNKEARRHDLPELQEGKSLLLLTASVSMDALTVGFSLGTSSMPIFITVIIMGLIAGLMTLAGFRSGQIFSRLVGSYAQMVGGVILLILAVRILM